MNVSLQTLDNIRAYGIKGQEFAYDDAGYYWTQFVGANINKIASDPFNITASRLSLFNCYECVLQHQPPKYNLQTTFSQMTTLTDLRIGLNLTDDQSLNHVLPNKQSQLEMIDIRANKFTIKTGALKYLEYLALLSFNGATIKKIEREAFIADYHSNFTRDFVLLINFRHCKLASDNGTFQDGAFDGIPKSPVQVTFESMDITSLPEGAFKSLLNNTKNSIALYDDSTIDCNNCANYWLIKEKKEKQITNAHCKDNVNKTLFDTENQTKLSKKCK